MESENLLESLCRRHSPQERTHGSAGRGNNVHGRKRSHCEVVKEQNAVRVYELKWLGGKEGV